MSIKHLSATVAAIAFSACALTAQANNKDTDHRWMPKQSNDTYWQTPPAYKNTNQRPAARSPATNRAAPPPPPGPYRGAIAPRTEPNRGATAPRTEPNRGATAPRTVPYRNPPVPRAAYNEPSAFNTPGYTSPRYNRRGSKHRGKNRWGSNKFWGRSGPSTWMNPGKRNWENSWDDMINSPSRMGEMPGGWTAPEVSMPNPIDMSDQMQDNAKDLPDQMRDGNIGNDVSN